MTQQFKFGDHVKWGDDPRQCIYWWDAPEYEGQAGWIISEDGAKYLVTLATLKLVHPPQPVGNIDDD